MMLVVSRSTESKAAELAAYKADAITKLNEMSEQVRSKFITTIAGQEMIYLMKEREATAYMAADPEPVDLTDYPFIAGEVGTTGQTAYEVAQVILNLADLWRVVGASLEQVRITTLAGIQAATSKGEVDQIVTTAEQTLNNL
jgi:hypothetical protein